MKDQPKVNTRGGHSQGSLRPLWFFYVPTELIVKSCETGPPVYRPYPRRLGSLIICRCHFLLSYLKTLSVGPAGA